MQIIELATKDDLRKIIFIGDEFISLKKFDKFIFIKTICNYQLFDYRN